MLQKQPSELALLCEEFRKNNHIDPAQFEQYQVKRGLRNPDGTGVMAGLTHICNVHGYLIADGEKVRDEVIFINQGQVVLQSSVDEIREERGMSVDALFREVFKC